MCVLKTINPLFALLLAIAPAPLAADIVKDAWGILTDPLKLGSGSSNLLASVREARDAISALDDLQAQTDENVRHYLADIDEKIADIDGRTEARIAQVADEILEIEEVIVRDIKTVIRDVECAAIRTLEDALEQTFRDILPAPLEGSSRYVQMPFGTQRGSILGFIPWGEQPRVLEIDLSTSPPPDKIFRDIESAYLQSLSEATDDDRAIVLIATYANLARLAKKTSCFYQGGHFEDVLTRKYIFYNARIYPWTETLKVEG